MNKIAICNQLWTRKCNLSCDYCKISLNGMRRSYILRPSDYPDHRYYANNERSGEFWIDVNERLYKYNPDMFHVLYGGEIFLRHDCEDILKRMNDIGSKYTIISSANRAIQKDILDVLNNIGHVCGFTCSVDPGFFDELLIQDNDEREKSVCGFDFLKLVKQCDFTNDVTAEITVSKDNIKYLYETVKILSDNDIWSSITLLDLAKTNYYDFSTVTNPKVIFEEENRDEFIQVFNDLKNSNFKIHMKDIILDKLLSILPCEYKCGIDMGNIHNITIDSDGKIRLCLRIRGIYSPRYEISDIINEDGDLKQYSWTIDVSESMYNDYDSLCKGCNWTCPMMSELGTSHDIINH